MQGLHSVLGNMRIDLRRGQIAMAQQQLDNSQVRAMIEQMRRKGMP
tara:strand:+ start:618 stop:755 length:138 start_codon:yes stop_codon:yes gene_type:complete